MKRITALLLVLIFMLGIVPVMAATQREVWVPSPGITTGMSVSELMVNKAIQMGDFRMYRLDSIGDGYYLGVIEEQRTDGGSNGKKHTSIINYYSILETVDGFIVLGNTGVYNEYYWDSLESVADISDNIDWSYYTSANYEVPCYIINPLGKYTYSDWTEYNEFIFIGSNGSLGVIRDSNDLGEARYPYVYDGKLYSGKDRYVSSGTWYDYKTSDTGEKASNSNIIGIKNGAIKNVASSVLVERNSMTTGNGYTLYKEGYTGNVDKENVYSIPGNSKNFYKYAVSKNNQGTYNVVLSVNTIDENNTMKKVNSRTFTTTATTKPTYTVESISGLTDAAYSNIGISMPVLKTSNMYVMKNGDIYYHKIGSDFGTYYFCVYKNQLAIIRNIVSGNYIRYADENGTMTYWQRVNVLIPSTNKTLVPGEDIDIPVGTSTNLNGYFSSYSSFVNSTAFSTHSPLTIKNWWKHYQSNVFPDGRYVEARWFHNGDSTYEIWYDIYKSDGTLISSGPTGFSEYYGSSSGKMNLMVFAMNNTKMIITTLDLHNDWYAEYYRASVVNEDDDGIIQQPGIAGEKYIVPPQDSETIPSNPVIDFAEENLPLGFMIKENVIGTEKFNSELRERINTIRLETIVIVASDGYVSGKENIGVTLEDYDEYEYSFGDSPIRFYTNGQYFCWYCSEPEDLEADKYEINIPLGDITLCGTLKVIEPPDNNSSVTVVF